MACSSVALHTFFPRQTHSYTVNLEYFVRTQFSYPGLSGLSYAWNFRTVADCCGFSDLLCTFRMHFSFVRKLPRSKYSGFTVVPTSCKQAAVIVTRRKSVIGIGERDGLAWVWQGGVEKKICTNTTATKKERGEEAPMPRTVRGLPQTERHFCRCYACGWSCWFGASDWTCWSKPVRAICGGSCCFGARSTPVRAIWTAESFPSTLSLSWLWRDALRSCLLMASSTGSGSQIHWLILVWSSRLHPGNLSLCLFTAHLCQCWRIGSTRGQRWWYFQGLGTLCRHLQTRDFSGRGRGGDWRTRTNLILPSRGFPKWWKSRACTGHLIEQRERRHRTESKSVKFYFQNKPDDHRRQLRS